MRDQNKAIEYCGLYWHSDARGKYDDYHKKKMIAANAKGIELIQIFEDEYVNYPNTVLGKIKSFLTTEACVMVDRYQQISIGDANEFLNDNSLVPLNDNASHIGVYSANILVGVVEIIENDEDIVITQFSELLGTKITNLFAFVIDAFKNKNKTLSYIHDNRWGYAPQGLVKCGFTLDLEIEPVCWDVINQTSRAISGGGDTYNKIWDCGHQKWVWRADNIK